jgi:membrane protein YdbS with pleckstrin-like domain
VYDLVKRLIFPLLKVDAAGPHPPAGHQPHEQVQVLRAAPSYLRYRLFIWFLYAALWGTAVIIAVAVLLLTSPIGLVIVIPLTVLAVIKAAVLYVVTRLDYEMRWYVLTDRSLLIRQGVWTVREITLTFANAQNVRVTQGPLQRLFGFSNVEVDTAGGGSRRREDQKGLEFDPHRPVLRGLEKPGEVRTLIVDLIRRGRSAGLGDPDEMPETMTTSGPRLLEEILAEARALRAVIGDHA